MIISLLHISDLHRDPSHPLTNAALLDSLARDRDHFTSENTTIKMPDLILVSGDIVAGVKSDAPDGTLEIGRQYAEAESFLAELADLFVGGDRERVIITPGNHDISYTEFKSSLREIHFTTGDPVTEQMKAQYVRSLYTPGSKLRWSWQSLSFFELVDPVRYRSRLAPFSDFYSRFYRGSRSYLLEPEKQYDIFDYPDLGLIVAAFSSCYNNDPLNRVGSIHPDCIAGASRTLREDRYRGRVRLAMWHHNVSSTPSQIDYMDPDTVQVLIDCGFSLGFHGHQHKPQFIDELFQFGMDRKMTVIGASTLCGGRDALPTGQPRSYNIIQINTESFTGTLHLRSMQNNSLASPIWGPGSFASSHRSYIGFSIQPPAMTDRDRTLLILAEAETHLSRGRHGDAIRLSLPLLQKSDYARKILIDSFVGAGDKKGIIQYFYPPTTTTEIVYLADALCEEQRLDLLRDMINSRLVQDSIDPAIVEVRRKYSGRLK